MDPGSLCVVFPTGCCPKTERTVHVYPRPLWFDHVAYRTDRIGSRLRPGIPKNRSRLGTSGRSRTSPKAARRARRKASTQTATSVAGAGDGAAADGEVEDHRLTILSPPPWDFGDAPPPYPTTASEGGARHTATGPRLGTNRDTEPDGAHSAAADWDDSNGTPDDEDGVTLPVVSVSGIAATTATVEVELQTPDPAANYLDAWIDFDSSGDWSQADERVFGRRLLPAPLLRFFRRRLGRLFHRDIVETLTKYV